MRGAKTAMCGYAQRMTPLLAFRQDESSSFPEFTAQGLGGTYQISKPPFAASWRAAFMPDGAVSERTVLERIGTGTFPSFDAAVGACEQHRSRPDAP